MTALAKKPALRAREDARRAVRATIRQVAEQVFVRSGFAATKMTDIACAAGVAVGTLYNYFESKEEIFEDIVGFRCAAMRASLSQALEHGGPRDKIAAVVRSSLENLDRHGALFAVFVERGGFGELDLARLGGQLAEQEYQRFLRTLGEVLREGVEARELRRDVSVATMVAVLSGALNGVAYAWLKGRRRGCLVDSADDVLELFLAGARTPT